jgi:hypothetical protein
MNKEVKVDVNGVSITLTKEQLAQINKQQSELKPVTERIQTFDDIIAESGKPASYFTDKNLSADELGYRKVKAICEVYNEGWVLDFTDKNQKKWYPYFDASSSFGFSASICVYWYANSTGGSRLCSFKSEELARDAGKKFIKEYEEWLNKE